MPTTMQKQRDELSQRITGLKHRYRATAEELRLNDFLAGVLQEWRALKAQVSNAFGKRDARLEVRRHEGFLYELSEELCRRFDELVLSYETAPSWTKTREFAEQTFEATSALLNLYAQNGLHRLGGEVDKRLNSYRSFIGKLEADLDLHSGTPIAPDQPSSGRISLIYDKEITIADNNLGGTRNSFSLLIGKDLCEWAYWTVLQGFYGPQTAFFPLGKKSGDLTKDDAALIVANAFIRKSKDTRPVIFGPVEVARYLSERHGPLIAEIHYKVKTQK